MNEKQTDKLSSRRLINGLLKIAGEKKKRLHRDLTSRAEAKRSIYTHTAKDVDPTQLFITLTIYNVHIHV